jgi:hypothetical protein
MNISTYIPDDLLRSVDDFAHQSRLSRSAIIRDALEHYLRLHRIEGWPQVVRTWNGDPTFSDFDSIRRRIAVTDPFASVV